MSFSAVQLPVVLVVAIVSTSPSVISKSMTETPGAPVPELSTTIPFITA